MRTREEIRAELLNRLDSTWNGLKDSVVGKELLSLGVETVMYAEECTDAIKTAFDVETASKEMLISMSHVYKIPISFVRPATVTVKIDGGGYYEPYSLSLSKGSVTYYNIEYVNASNEVTLYQGTVMRENDPSVVAIPNDTLYDKIGYKLQETIPRSVYVVKANIADQLSAYDPMSPTEDSYRLYTLSDGTLFLEYAKSVSVIYYLLPTSSVNNLDGATLNTGATYTILSTTPYEGESLNCAREYFRKFFLEMNAVVSKSQIHDYVNTFPNVLDCNVVPFSITSVNIYVKPNDRNQVISTFGEIESALDEHGMLGVFHNVSLGTAFPIKLICSNIPLDMQATIATLLEDSFRYELTTFNASLTPYAMSSLIHERTGISTDVRIFVNRESVSNGDQLRFKIIRGTLSVLQQVGDDFVAVGFDSNGSIYMQEFDAENEGGGALINVNGWYGDAIYSTGNVSLPIQYFSTELNTLAELPPTTALGAGPIGATVMTFGDYIYEETTVSGDTRTFVYFRSDATLQNFMLEKVFPINNAGFQTNGWECALYIDTLLCTIEGSETYYDFKFYRDGETSFYTRTTSVPSSATIHGNIFFENSWYIFYNDGTEKCLVYSNIRTSRENVTIQGTNFGVNNIRFIGSNKEGDVVIVGANDSSITGLTIAYCYGLSIQYGNVVTNVLSTKVVPILGVNDTTTFDPFNRGSNYIELHISDRVNSYRIYDNEDTVNYMSGFWMTQPSTEPVGRIDYTTSRIQLNRSNIVVQYMASAINYVNENEYFVLDETEPIIFD